MDDDRTVDRRSFLRGASTAGLVGLSGIGSARPFAGRDDSGLDDGDRSPDVAEQETSPIEYMRAVLPAGFILSESLVYRIVVVGGPIRPHERPPPLCFPAGEKDWTARAALVVKPTEETGVFGADDDIGAINRTRVHLEEPAEPGSVWRISGGSYCDGNALTTIHELPPQISEYFSKDMIDAIERFEDNETAGNATEGAEPVESGPIGDETDGRN